MAIIGKTVPKKTNRRASRRVVIKLLPSMSSATRDAIRAELERIGGDSWRTFLSAFPGQELKPYFSRFTESTLRGLKSRTTGILGVQSPFLRYFVLEPAPGTDLVELARRASRLPGVEIAYVESGPTPPPVQPNDDPRARFQIYLDAAPVGIDAHHAWSKGLDGHTIGFVDLETGWLLDHVDLSEAGIQLISGANREYHGHGTAVLGQVVAADNTVGCIGIAPRSYARVVSQYRSDDENDYHTADAILTAAIEMERGDVLLLEAQAWYAGYESTYFPVEVEDAVFDAIAYATFDLGIIVVEAGGNGAFDLDAFRDVNGRAPLNREGEEFRDSGAILVGAASSGTPHERLWFSNFGSRIDCFAWGEDIATCGDGNEGMTTDEYTNCFGGTSGASPIVAGAAILIQQSYKQESSAPLDPISLRELLSSNWNTPSADPSSDRIGFMPDLRAILER